VIPRVLSIGEDGHLKQAPLPEFEKLRSGEESMNGVALNNGSVEAKASSDPMEIKATFDVTSAASVGLDVSGTPVVFDVKSGYVTVAGKEKIFAGRDKTVTLRVFLDRRMMEVYANGSALVHLVDPREPALRAFARDGAATVRSLKSWRLKPAVFDMKHYRG
jgi:sucrose-6-phosphate hydrolase SacC (GH32 family)